jgi:hypothetical protein
MGHSDMPDNKLSNALASLWVAIVMALVVTLYFPGGTIVMALSCDNRELDGWDWVLSVVIPGYGAMKSLLSC